MRTTQPMFQSMLSAETTEDAVLEVELEYVPETTYARVLSWTTEGFVKPSERDVAQALSL